MADQDDICDCIVELNIREVYKDLIEKLAAARELRSPEDVEDLKIAFIATNANCRLIDDRKKARGWSDETRMELTPSFSCSRKE